MARINKYLSRDEIEYCNSECIQTVLTEHRKYSVAINRMPIDIENFKTTDSMKQLVKEFLQSHRDKAYLATELFEVMKGRKPGSQVDLFEIQGILYVLTKERSIVSRFVETKNVFHAYYSISEG